MMLLHKTEYFESGHGVGGQVGSGHQKRLGNGR